MRHGSPLTKGHVSQRGFNNRHHTSGGPAEGSESLTESSGCRGQRKLPLGSWRSGFQRGVCSEKKSQECVSILVMTVPCLQRLSKSRVLPQSPWGGGCNTGRLSHGHGLGQLLHLLRLRKLRQRKSCLITAARPEHWVFSAPSDSSWLKSFAGHLQRTSLHRNQSTGCL